MQYANSVAGVIMRLLIRYSYCSSGVAIVPNYCYYYRQCIVDGTAIGTNTAVAVLLLCCAVVVAVLNTIAVCSFRSPSVTGILFRLVPLLHPIEHCGQWTVANTAELFGLVSGYWYQ
jgi:hypothetical protein